MRFRIGHLSATDLRKLDILADRKCNAYCIRVEFHGWSRRISQISALSLFRPRFLRRHNPLCNAQLFGGLLDYAMQFKEYGNDLSPLPGGLSTFFPTRHRFDHQIGTISVWEFANDIEPMHMDLPRSLTSEVPGRRMGSHECVALRICKSYPVA